MSSSECRRLHRLFATPKSTSLPKSPTTVSLTKTQKPTTSVCRRLRRLFATPKSTSLPKSPTTVSVTRTQKPTTSLCRRLHALFATAKSTPKPSTTVSLTKTEKPTTSLCRRLHALFAAAKSTSRPKHPPLASVTKTQKPTTTNDETLLALVAKFKKDSDRFRYPSHKEYFEKTVSRLAAANKHSLIDEILQHQKQHPDITNEAFTVRLIALYGKSGMFDHARKLFDEMPQLKCQRTVMSFNALLSACVDSKRFDVITELFSELPGKLWIKPNRVSFNTVVKALCEIGSLDSALSVVNGMEKSGVEPDLITFHTLLDAFYKNDMFEEAEKVWGLMQDKNVVPNRRTYNPEVRALRLHHTFVRMISMER